MTIPYPRISSELFHFGPIALRWYGLMYLVGYMLGTWLAKRRLRRRPAIARFTEQAVDTLVVYLLVGMLVGARLVYVLVYDRQSYVGHPWQIVEIWRGGLSFHGAVIGMGIACLVFARRHRIPFWAVADTFAYAGTPGLFFGRIGNFINGELYGRPTNVPWAMIFPTDPQQVPRHPSQLYEAFCEGVVLFILIALLEREALRRGWYRPGLLAGSFLIGYGVIRFLLEFTRQPDSQLGLVLGPFSMGQLLSALTLIAGLIILIIVYRRPHESRITASPL